MTNPPRVAEALLSSLGADPTYRDSVLGDLAEEFEGRTVRDGVTAARWWYYSEALRSAPHLVRSFGARATGRDARRVGRAALVALFGLFIVALVLGGVATGIASGLGVRLSVRTLPAPAIALLSIVGMAWTMIGGYFAASVDKETPLISALALGTFWCAVDVVAYLFAPERATWQAFVPLLPLIGVTVGGMLRAGAPAVSGER
jgi:hypothetical protein